MERLIVTDLQEQYFTTSDLDPFRPKEQLRSRAAKLARFMLDGGTGRVDRGERYYGVDRGQNASFQRPNIRTYMQDGLQVP